MTNRLTPMLGVALLGLSACAQPLAPSPVAIAVVAPRYAVQAAPAPQTALEQAILRRINVERRRHGLKPLRFSAAMRGLARQHSLDMATSHYFGHTDLHGREPYARMRATGIPFISYGETESHRPVGGNTPEDAIKDWLMHPYGKKYMLGDDFDVAGVGVYRSGRYYYVTVEYMRPR